MAVEMMGVTSGREWLSRRCRTCFVSGSVLICVTASALAGAKPSQSTVSGPTAVIDTMNRKCETAVARDEPAFSESIRASDSAAALKTAVSDVTDVTQPPTSEMLQDKLWSTNLSRSSTNDVPKARQCGLTTVVPPPAN
jgi:hypothetical protein